MADELVIRVHDEVDHAVLRMRGRLSLRTMPRIRDAMVKRLQGTGRVLIDLSNVRASQSAMVTVFATASDLAGGWPSARLVLFGADPALRLMLNSARVPETVPVAADLLAARALLEQRPAQVRRHRDLPMHQAAAAAARAFVRETCLVWSVPDVVEDRAELVCSELVTNAVMHARSSTRVTLTCGKSALRVSVRDYCPGPVPRPRPIDLEALSGRGLHLVALFADNWDVHQHPDGKTIWANLAYPRGRRE
jgi:anti-sigma regulatory factor (Ser/Thr protein kinase)/anti-anti-sigma regulatory factor